MPQVTLSVPNKKLPLFKNLLSALGIENKDSRNFLQATTFKSNSTASQKNIKHSFFNKYCTWEYYSNELEFE